jgi:hypothetical protein
MGGWRAVRDRTWQRRIKSVDYRNGGKNKRPRLVGAFGLMLERGV